MKKLFIALIAISSLPYTYTMQSRIAKGIYGFSKGINIILPLATAVYGICEHQRQSKELKELSFTRTATTKQYPALMNLHNTVMDELNISSDKRIPTLVVGFEQGQGPSLQTHAISLSLPDAHILNNKIQSQIPADIEAVNSYKVKLRHEIGHFNNNDQFKNTIVPVIGSATLQALSSSYALYAPKPIPLTIASALLSAPKLLAGGVIKSFIANSLLPLLYARHAESTADNFAFQNTKNADELIAHAQEFEKINANITHILSTDIGSDDKGKELVDFVRSDAANMHDMVKNKQTLSTLLHYNDKLRALHFLTKSQLDYPAFVQMHYKKIMFLLDPQHPLLLERANNARKAAEMIVKNKR